MAFPPHFLDELRLRVALSDVVARKVKLLKRGREHSGLCPFHNEKSPSFTVSDEKGFFHCFGCGAHGDVIGFEMRAQGLSFVEAVERLAGQAGLDMPRQSPEEQARARSEAGLHEAMEAATAFFETALRRPEGAKALEYLHRRGLDDTTIGRWRLGWAPDSRHGLKNGLMSDTFPEYLLREAGLLIAPEGAERGSYDRFRGRVMFPISDRRGRIIAFGGRLLGDGQPKYLNSPDTPLFHKGRVLFGLAKVREAARRTGEIVVVEGYMDVIALHAAGIETAVAPLGTALTETQIEELWRLVPEPIICLDGDAAGQRAAARAAERVLPMLKQGHSLRFATLPAGQDPDDLIRRDGALAMRALLDRAQPLADLVWRMEAEGRPVDTPEQRAAIEHGLTEKALLIPDRTLQKYYLEMMRTRLWEALKALRQGNRSGGRFAGQKGNRNRDRRFPPPAPFRAECANTHFDRNRRQIEILLATAINHPDLLMEVDERLGSMEIPDTDLDKLRREVLDLLHGAEYLDSATLRRHLTERGFSTILESVMGVIIPHAGFARAGAAFEDAREGWEQTFRLLQHREIEADLQEEQKAFAASMTDENWGRFLAKKRDSETDLNDEGEAEPQDGLGRTSD